MDISIIKLILLSCCFIHCEGTNYTSFFLHLFSQAGKLVNEIQNGIAATKLQEKTSDQRQVVQVPVWPLENHSTTTMTTKMTTTEHVTGPPVSSDPTTPNEVSISTEGRTTDDSPILGGTKISPLNKCNSEEIIEAKCENGGECNRVRPGVYGCICHNGYSGTNCETGPFGEIARNTDQTKDPTKDSYRKRDIGILVAIIGLIITVLIVVWVLRKKRCNSNRHRGTSYTDIEQGKNANPI